MRHYIVTTVLKSGRSMEFLVCARSHADARHLGFCQREDVVSVAAEPLES